MKLNHEQLMLLGGIGAFVLTLVWVRNRELREKYALAWMGVACALLGCGLFPNGIKAFAQACGLSYPAATLFVALSAIYVFSFTVSVSLSRQFRRNVRLAQSISLLELRIAELEHQLTPPLIPVSQPPARHCNDPISSPTNEPTVRDPEPTA
jgi:hypothetical protein